jgi:hypothetical protein
MTSIACFFVALLGYFVIPAQLDTVNRNSQSFDTWGAVTGVLGLVMVNVAWNQAPTSGWGTSWIIVLLLLGIVSLVLFAFAESRAAHPLVPLSILNTDTSLALLCIGLGWASFGVWYYYI